MSQPRIAKATATPLNNQVAVTLSKEVRRPKEARKRALPMVMRKRLALLGHAVPSGSDKDEQLNILVDKLSNDLNTYAMQAKHWQDKYLQLKAAVNTSLTLAAISAPKLQSTPGRFVSGHTLDTVLQAMNSASAIWIRDTLKCPNGSIANLKPDFSRQKARQFWDDLFAPINANPSCLIFDSAPACRRSSEDEEDDQDMDHLERKIANASDLEVIDMLHYCSLFMSGIQKPVFENSELTIARDHLGRNCERLLREVIFSRGLTTNPKLAQCLVDGLLGTVWHFGTHNRATAILSVLEIAWQIHEEHASTVHPFTRGIIAYISTVIAPTASRRAMWMSRNLETIKSTPQKFFYLTATSYFTSCFYALLTNDEDLLLHYFTQMDDLLAPHVPGEKDRKNNFVDFQNFAIFNPLPDSSNNELPSPTLSSNSSTHLGVWDAPFHPRNVSFAIRLGDDPSAFDHPLPDFFGPQFGHTSSSDDEGSDLNASSSDSPIPSYSYNPPEHLKALMRVMVHLLRAEAALIHSDYANCEHWLDEAEREMQGVPHMPTVQTEEILMLRVICKRTCPFPAGTRTVIQEFERRTTNYHAALSRLAT
jgi:hypothetical protein